MSTPPAQSHRPDAPGAQPPRADEMTPSLAPPGPLPPDSGLDRLADSKDLKTLSVRALLSELATVEERLRDTPFLLTESDTSRVNPEVARLLARQRAVVTQLRARRVSWASNDTARERSAAWPPPPWS